MSRRALPRGAATKQRAVQITSDWVIGLISACAEGAEFFARGRTAAGRGGT